MIKKILILFLLSVCSVGFASGQIEQRKKVGVVLSGGAAKGFAHVGVLKVLEEAGIPIDYIAGTSMGAVVGGLYAVGYTAEMIDSLIHLQDWNFLMRDQVSRKNLSATQRDYEKKYLVSLPYKLSTKGKSSIISLPQGVYAGQNIYSLFLNLTIGYQHEMKFDDLPIPFACVAADVRKGEEVVFHEGLLPMAMRASMAIPGIFMPVEKDSMLLIDGGFINNFPVDIVRKMGADIVIGVFFPMDEQSIEKSQGSINEVTEQLWHFIASDKRKQNIKDTDLLIKPALHPYGASDFTLQAIDSIISRGVNAAMDMKKELIALKQSLHIVDDPNTVKKIKNPYINVDTIVINNIRMEGVSPREEKMILGWLSLQDNRITRQQLDIMTSRIYGSGLFSQVHYRLDGDQPFDLIFSVEQKQTNTLNVGFHFDTKDMASILANTTIRLNRSLHSMFDITGRLSRDPYLTVDYSINNGLFYKGGIKYKIGRNDLQINHRGKLVYNAQVIRNTVSLNFSEFNFGNIRLHLGAGLENIHFSNPLHNASNTTLIEEENQFYINYTLSGVYDNLDNTYFPSSGHYLAFQYSIHTDNFIQLNDDLPLNIIMMNACLPIQLIDKICLTSRVKARYIMNKNSPVIYRNFVGGKTDGHYLPQQIGLQGSTGMEMLKNMVLSTDMGMHYSLKPNNYLYGNINFTIHQDNLHTLFEGESFWGASLGYSYFSIVGPISAEIGYSALSKRFHPYLSIGYYF